MYRYHIPAKTGLWTPLATIHNVDSNWGPDAGQYRPERWLQRDADYLQSPATGHSAGGGGPEQPSATGDATGSGELKHAAAPTARNFEMSISRAKVQLAVETPYLWLQASLPLVLRAAKRLAIPRAGLNCKNRACECLRSKCEDAWLPFLI